MSSLFYFMTSCIRGCNPPLHHLGWKLESPSRLEVGTRTMVTCGKNPYTCRSQHHLFILFYSSTCLTVFDTNFIYNLIKKAVLLTGENT